MGAHPSLHHENESWMVLSSSTLLLRRMPNRNVPCVCSPLLLALSSSSVNRPEMCVLEVDERRHANHDVLGYPGKQPVDGDRFFLPCFFLDCCRIVLDTRVDFLLLLVLLCSQHCTSRTFVHTSILTPFFLFSPLFIIPVLNSCAFCLVSRVCCVYSGGLGWGGNMRFRTGLNLIDLTAEVSRRLEHVKFPFLIMHDPGDSEYIIVNRRTYTLDTGYIFLCLTPQ